MVPAWAEGWHGDLQTLAAFMCDFLETLIGRYREHVRRWVVCAGFNHADGAGLSDDDRDLNYKLLQIGAGYQLTDDLYASLTLERMVKS